MKHARFFALTLTASLAGFIAACSEPEAPVSTSTSAVDAMAENAAEQAADPQAMADAALATEIALGSAVKRLCSSVLVGNRTVDHVMANELNNPALSEADFNFDDDIVTGAMAVNGGTMTVRALYREHLGCTLLKDVSPISLRAQFDPELYPAKPDVAGEPWPIGNLVELPETVPGFDMQAVHAAVDQAFEDMEPDQNIDTRAVLVIHDGKIIAEQYAEPFSADMPQLGWSMTKTVTGALTGILGGDGLLHVDANANVPEWRNDGDERRSITLEHLLHMTSGMQYSEVYTAGSMSDVILMLYTTGDTAAFTIDKPLAHASGSTFYYNSGTSNIISRIQRQLFTSFQDYFNFPQERLFSKLGMTSAVMEPDASGTFVGSSYMYATPRDWAKFGLLHLQDGMWNGERILPEGWVDYTVTPAPAAERGQYGVQMWLNAGAADNPDNRPLPNLPANMYYLSGFEGQNILMFPDQDLIVMRMGVTTSGPRPVWTLAESVLAAMDGATESVSP
ncbi:MAG: serine hydrolase [Pseudohongiella sp.]|uniref:serine hydrolase domain-containing protein n=1 Tax=Pseudohongiella sp. TaxID=1979412 RepID=UPI0034A09C00